MNEEEKLDDYLLTLQGLGKWEQKNNRLDGLLVAIREKERAKTTRWMVAASLMAIIFSTCILGAGFQKKQEISQIQIEQVSKTYAVTFLTY